MILELAAALAPKSHRCDVKFCAGVESFPTATFRTSAFGCFPTELGSVGGKNIQYAMAMAVTA
jgi:hypothetical protein